ncbi:uncharacterized protein LOC132066512 [Lycium ferocissimum]|uniref:uncharacterized protein LOC132066512 n=1 Tax=Lycium ferocissimum TaxID=112874 RepID=UPI0028153E74|nr:uncharacterized protein LOC132066512 [Lycium ferocissimum]
MSCPKHGLPDSVLLQTFYQSLDSVNKSVANNIAGGSMMDNSYNVMSALLDKLTKTNEAWHTREAERVGGGPSKIVLYRETIKKEEERDETMAKLITQMELLTKHVLGGSTKRVNAVGSCEGGSQDEQCFQIYDKEANFVNNQAGVPGLTAKVPIKDLGGKVKGIKAGAKIKGVHNGGTTIKVATTKNYNNHRSSNPYVPLKGKQMISSQPSISDPASSKIEDMLSRVLKKVESTDSFCKEIRDEMKSLGQVATLNQRQKGTLPSDTIANPKNDGDHKCHKITTRSGKIIGGETLVKENLVIDDEKLVEEPMVVEEEVTSKKKQASIEKAIIIKEVPENDEASKGKEAVEEVPRALPPVPNPPPQFPQRLAKKADDGKFLKFIEKLKELSMNIPLVEALEQMPGSIVTKALVQNNEDPGAFTIPCTIGMYKFAKALGALGVNINLIPLTIFNKLGLGTPRPTTMRLLMVDRIVKNPVGILNNVLVRVDQFIFLAEFVSLDRELDFKVPIILGRPFLATGRAFVDVERGGLKFRTNNEEITFHICKSMKQPTDMSVVSVFEQLIRL